VRVCVCGGRDVAGASLARSLGVEGRADGVLAVRLAARLRGYEPEQIVLVSGGARGADEIGERWAEANGVRIERFEAEWSRLGRAAGVHRNKCMIRSRPDFVAALWDGNSRGTKNMIEAATRAGIPVEIIPVSARVVSA